MPTQRFNKWPDFFEITTDAFTDTVTSAVFVVVRKNSRSFQQDQLQTLKALEKVAKVAVRVGTKDLTLEQFEQQGSYDGNVSGPQVIAQSTYYNKKAELKRYEQQLREMQLDDEGRDVIWGHVQRLRAQLGLTQEGEMMDKQLTQSQEGLDRLKGLLNKARIEPENPWTDELLISLTWKELAEKVPQYLLNGEQNPLHFTLWNRKLELHKTKENTPNDTNKSTTKGEDKVGEQNAG